MASAGLAELLIDDVTWAAGSPERRAEWRVAIDEILQEGRFDFEGEIADARALITVEPSQVLFEVLLTGGRQLGGTEISLEIIRPYMTDYLDICLEMNRLSVGSNSPRLEALDIAKRIVHDDAGETVRSILRAPRPDHATARRIFTLLVTLLYDTSRLAARPHLQPH